MNQKGFTNIIKACKSLASKQLYQYTYPIKTSKCPGTEHQTIYWQSEHRHPFQYISLGDWYSKDLFEDYKQLGHTHQQARSSYWNHTHPQVHAHTKKHACAHLCACTGTNTEKKTTCTLTYKPRLGENTVNKNFVFIRISQKNQMHVKRSGG